jgi:hypothetical protein
MARPKDGDEKSGWVLEGTVRRPTTVAGVIACITLLASACAQGTAGTGAEGARESVDAASVPACVDGIAVQRLEAMVTSTKKGDLTDWDLAAQSEQYFGFAEVYRDANPDMSADLATAALLYAEANELWEAGGGDDLSNFLTETEEEFQESMALQNQALEKITEAGNLMAPWGAFTESIPFC